jgi:hypothetical protein
MTAAAVVAVVLLAAGYLALRWAEESRRIDDLIATVLSTPLKDEND